MESYYLMVVTKTTETPYGKIPKYTIVKNNSFISICYELKYLIHLELLL